MYDPYNNAIKFHFQSIGAQHLQTMEMWWKISLVARLSPLPGNEASGRWKGKLNG